MYVTIIIIMLCIFGWNHIFDGLATAPADASLIHPFHTKQVEGFNIWYFLIFAFMQVYTTGAWQGNAGFNAAAINPHEARMGKVLSTWRILPLSLFMMIVPICAYAFMHLPEYANQSGQAKTLLDQIINPQIRTQMTTTIALKYILPIGAVGAIVGVMLSAFIGNCDTYLHSWGSIFIQDVVMPFRKKSLTPAQHIRFLKWSIFGVAIFIFIFSLVFRQTEYIYMFFMITGAIFLGGAGAVVVGGLYWKRGTTAAAWCTMIAGSVLSVAAVIIRQIHQTHPFTGKIMGYIASQNGAVLTFYASVLACLIYIVVSLLGKRQVCDMDKILHRGTYGNQMDAKGKAFTMKKISALLGITAEFTLSDKILYCSTLVWTFIWIVIFLAGTIYNFFYDVSAKSWIEFWKIYSIAILAISVVTAVWFAIGGIVDVRHLFKLLKSIKRNENDDGTVTDHQNTLANAGKEQK
jgi:SSS family solute:Na+ symporter